MIRKIITTLGIVLLAIGMFSCEDSSTPSGPKFAEAQVGLPVGATTTYIVTLDKAVESVTDVTLKEQITLTHAPKTGTATTPSPSVTAATIVGKTIDLVFESITLTADDTLKIEIKAGAIADTTDKVKNAAIEVSVKAATRPVFAATQASLSPSTITEYIVTLDKEVALVDSNTAGFLKGEITLTHTSGQSSNVITLDTAEIEGADATKIKLSVNSGIVLAASDTLKIDIAEDAIQDTTNNVKNSAITVTVTANGPGFAETQDIVSLDIQSYGYTRTAYTVALDKNVELVDATSGFLAGKITLTHTHGGSPAGVNITNATIKNSETTKIDLEFESITIASGDTLKIEIAADAIQTVTDKYKNSAILVTVTVP